MHPLIFPQGVAAGPTIEDTLITQADLHPSVNPVAGEPSSTQQHQGITSEDRRRGEGVEPLKIEMEIPVPQRQVHTVPNAPTRLTLVYKVMEKGIKREYSIARSPQQIGVAKRKNRTLIEAVRTMLADSKLLTPFWAEAVSTAIYEWKSQSGPSTLLRTELEMVKQEKEGVDFKIAKFDKSIPSPHPLILNRPTTFDLSYSGLEEFKEPEVNDLHLRLTKILKLTLYASYMGFMVYQMDVKSTFLYGQIEEEVYVCQPPSFEDPDHPDKVYKVVKALYGMHQAPRAWYDTLANYLLCNGFQRGKIDQTLFIKRQKGHILLVQIYVDDIIFGSTKKELCDEFEKLMKDKFQMSSMGELTFFLGLQIQQKKKGIFISQDKYVNEILRKFNYTDVKSASTPTDLEKPLVQDGDAADVDEHLYRSMIGSLMYLTTSRPDIMFAVCACARFQVSPKTSHLLAVKRIFRYLKGKPSLGLWYSKDSPLELVAYTDSDYAGATQDRKSTTRVATSITKAEYVAAASCCGQVLWIQNQLLDYGYNFMNTVIYIDNNSTICIIENPVQHSKTKHIEIRHHFIRDCNAKKLIQMAKIDTEHNVADLLTKGFDAGRFQYLVSSIGMLNP
ncbi:putative ribonuclease H-like domain-containing protein [Tanacetum coccineum]